jgi:hypothetical protein
VNPNSRFCISIEFSGFDASNSAMMLHVKLHVRISSAFFALGIVFSPMIHLHADTTHHERTLSKPLNIRDPKVRDWLNFGSAAHADYFSITDTYDPLSNRRAFYDTSYMLPPAMLESYVEKWPTPSLENFLYMLRSGMMGWVSIMIDTRTWTLEQHDAARSAIALYKEKLRPLIRDAQLYHISARPDGVHWDGMEYWDPTRRRGVLFTFRGTIDREDDHAFVLASLDATRRYRLHFQDRTSPDHIATGRELTTRGASVHLAGPLSSELVFIEEVK